MTDIKMNAQQLKLLQNMIPLSDKAFSKLLNISHAQFQGYISGSMTIPKTIAAKCRYIKNEIEQKGLSSNDVERMVI